MKKLNVKLPQGGSKRALHSGMYASALAVVVLAVVISLRLHDSRLGRAWVAIREDEIAAKAMGLNTRNLKLLAFGLAHAQARDAIHQPSDGK